MTVDQAIELGNALIAAANTAISEGKSVIDVLSVLQAADDEARDELQAAIDAQKGSSQD